jgi:hypothetical protein
MTRSATLGEPEAGRKPWEAMVEVMAEMGGDREMGEAIAEGVRDAAEGRRPRW